MIIFVVINPIYPISIYLYFPLGCKNILCEMVRKIMMFQLQRVTVQWNVIIQQYKK